MRKRLKQTSSKEIKKIGNYTAKVNTYTVTPAGYREISEDVDDDEVLRRPGAKQGQRRTGK